MEKVILIFGMIMLISGAIGLLVEIEKNNHLYVKKIFCGIIILLGVIMVFHPAEFKEAMEYTDTPKYITTNITNIQIIDENNLISKNNFRVITDQNESLKVYRSDMDKKLVVGNSNTITYKEYYNEKTLSNITLTKETINKLGIKIINVKGKTK